MSKKLQDIRSFFAPVSKKTSVKDDQVTSSTKSSDTIDMKSPVKHKNLRTKKRPIVSDDEVTSPVKSKKEPKTKKLKRICVVSSSDSEGEVTNSKVQTPKKVTPIKEPIGPIKKLTPKKEPNSVKKSSPKKEIKPEKIYVSVLEAFGNSPIKQTKLTNTEIDNDDLFEKSLVEFDDETLIANAITPAKKSTQKSNEEENDEKTPQRNGNKSPQKNSAEKTPQDNIKKNPWKNSARKTSQKTNSKKSPQKNNLEYNNDVIPNTPSNERKISGEDDTGTDPDLERFEKKRYSAMLYQKYLNRKGPAHLGSKILPQGKNDCLKGCVFVITGVLDSLNREDATSLITSHGGHVVAGVTKKVNYMLTGEDAGPAKLEKARKQNVNIISEDELIDLICDKSGIINENKTKVYNEIKKKNKEIEEKITVKKEVLSKVKPNLKKLENKKELKTPKKILETELKASPAKKIKLESTVREVKIERIQTTMPDENIAWVDKYKPKSVKDIIGQQGNKSNASKLMFWLENWYKNHNGKTKLTKPSPWAKDDNGSYFKAALLSGPPGVGKTTTATIVSKGLGFDVVEFNASNTRNKRMIQEEIAQLLKTTTLHGYFTAGTAPSKKHVLLMDEVDGMSGNEDRGGMQELISLVKNSNVPIICMCNDRQHPKIRSLANYCFDLRFAKPRLEQIKGQMMSICFKENIDIDSEAVSQIIMGTGMDIRQTLNNLSMWSASKHKISTENAEKGAKASQKDTKLGPWEVIRKVFTESEHKTMSLTDKFRLFFNDYSIGPLFVQENYLAVMPHCQKADILKCVANAADCISLGDVIDSKIRTNQSWGLLEMQGLYASVLPGEYMEGHFVGQINFPGWLGKNSKRNKFTRLNSELQAHMRTSISGGRLAVNLDYSPYIRDAIIRPLIQNGQEGIPTALETMQNYHLLREDLNNLIELTHWPKTKDLFSSIDSKVKAAFTRAYNKDCGVLPYAVAAPVKKKRAESQEDQYEEEDEEPESEDDDVNNDAMIKAKKPTVKPTKAPSTKGKATAKTKGKRGK